MKPAEVRFLQTPANSAQDTTPLKIEKEKTQCLKLS